MNELRGVVEESQALFGWSGSHGMNGMMELKCGVCFDRNGDDR